MALSKFEQLILDTYHQGMRDSKKPKRKSAVAYLERAYAQGKINGKICNNDDYLAPTDEEVLEMVLCEI